MKFQNPSMHGTQNMACIRFHSDFFQRGKTPERERTLTRKNMCQLFCHEESIDEISKP